MNPFSWPFRGQFLFGAVACASLLAYALYAQYRMFLDPCPLCILQRVVFMIMGGLFLLGALHGPKRWGRGIYGVLVFFVAAVGMGIAGRHVWLQGLPPDQVPACGPGLEYMLDAFPLSKTLSMVFTGSGECANVDWNFLGLSMPAWVLVWYLLLGLGALWAGLRRR
ncbi:disulfide bond formation protein B [Xanthomonadaceae bacterium JHOS43]|nr:disulfide bond formation protein B [Xanthomonadaceae bacterium JHOS43]MCX7563199.1 disulfide bond formation protein B [Xanthomonadaceae bacterium XH05]